MHSCTLPKSTAQETSTRVMMEARMLKVVLTGTRRKTFCDFMGIMKIKEKGKAQKWKWKR